VRDNIVFLVCVPLGQKNVLPPRYGFKQPYGIVWAGTAMEIASQIEHPKKSNAADRQWKWLRPPLFKSTQTLKTIFSI
jgi:hypothetical protein